MSSLASLTGPSSKDEIVTERIGAVFGVGQKATRRCHA